MKNYRWFIIVLAFAGTVINYLDRSALSYAITPIQQAFHLNEADFGLIAAAFGVGYVMMTLLGGILVDKMGAHKIWTAAALLWSLASILLGSVSGFVMLFGLRLLLGIAEGPAFPAMTRTVTDWLPLSERARALGVGLGAVPFASVIGAPLIAYLIVYFNWRWMFVCLGSLGIFWAIAWFYFFTDKPSQNRRVTEKEQQQIAATTETILSNTKTSQPVTWRFILLNPTLLSNHYAFFAFGYLLFFALNWLPGYFEKTYGVHLKQEALFLMIPWLLSTVMVIAGGVLSDWLWRKTRSIRIARTHLIWTSLLLAALCFVPVLFSPSLKMAIFFISLGLGIGFIPNAAFYAINADLAAARVGTSLGVMDAGFALAGILSPGLTGYLTQLTGNFNAAIFLLIGFISTAAIGVFFCQHPD